MGRTSRGARAGLRQGDLITAVDGVAVDRSRSVDATVAAVRARPGREVHLTVRRAGRASLAGEAPREAAAVPSGGAWRSDRSNWSISP